MSIQEDKLYDQLLLMGFPQPEREYRFHPTRRWRFDFAWPREQISLEYQGGIYTRGGHVRGLGYENDAEKLNQATVLGWRCLFATPNLVKSHKIFWWLSELLNQSPPTVATPIILQPLSIRDPEAKVATKSPRKRAAR